MIQIPTYNMAGELQNEESFDEARLGGEVREEVLRQAIITYEANQREGNAKTKTRAETNYSNAKPWPQKHTGRARAGSRNSPLWVGGAVTFGPQPRDYSKKMNRKMRLRALASAILGKMESDEVMIVEEIELDQPKTREMAAMLKALGVERKFLIVLPDHDSMLWRCTRNIEGSTMMAARELNAYRVLWAHDVIFTPDAFEATVERLEKQLNAANHTTETMTEGE